MRTSFVAAAALAFLAAMTCPQATAISLQIETPGGNNNAGETPEMRDARLKQEREAREEEYKEKYGVYPSTHPDGKVVSGPHKDHKFDQSLYDDENKKFNAHNRIRTT